LAQPGLCVKYTKLDLSSNQHLNLTETIVSKPTRLGVPKTNKPRWLRIEIKGLAAKRYILRNATKLRASSKWSNVYISPDSLPKECEQNKQFCEELRTRKAAGEKDL